MASRGAGHGTADRVQPRVIPTPRVARCLLPITRMRGIHFLVSGLTCLALAGTARAEESVRKAADADAASALDSVLENVVSGTARDRSRGSSSGAKGSLEIRKTDGARPVIKGSVIVGADNAPGFHKRTIDWDFAKGTGTFESVRRDASETYLVSVIADRPEHQRQVVKSSGGPIERVSIVDTRTVRLKAGGAAKIVKTDERVVVAKSAIVHFESSGQPRLLAQGGYTKSTGADGALLFTKGSIEVGGQPVTPEQLDAFVKTRVEP